MGNEGPIVCSAIRPEKFWCTPPTVNLPSGTQGDPNDTARGGEERRIRVLFESFPPNRTQGNRFRAFAGESGTKNFSRPPRPWSVRGEKIEKIFCQISSPKLPYRLIGACRMHWCRLLLHFMALGLSLPTPLPAEWGSARVHTPPCTPFWKVFLIYT